MNNNTNTKCLKCKKERKKRHVYRKAVDYYKKTPILSVFIFFLIY